MMLTPKPAAKRGVLNTIVDFIAGTLIPIISALAGVGIVRAVLSCWWYSAGSQGKSQSTCTNFTLSLPRLSGCPTLAFDL